MNQNKLPLVSFCIVAYKAEKYIREAIEGAFSQDYPNLEIIMSDDCSPDKTFDIMKEMAAQYSGPHKIKLNQNKENAGPREHYNTVLYDLAEGEILIIADGDDVSLPERTKVTVDFMLIHPEISSLSFNSQLIDENGNKLNLQNNELEMDDSYSVLSISDYVKYKELMIYSDDSRAFRRIVIEKFPKLKYSFAEDIYLFIRCLYIGPIAYIRKPLVLYRQHPESQMAKARSRKKVTRGLLRKFKNSSEKQILEDYEYAKLHNFFSEKDSKRILTKLYDVIYWLSPKRKSFCIRYTRGIFKRLGMFCELISKKLV